MYNLRIARNREFLTGPYYVREMAFSGLLLLRTCCPVKHRHSERSYLDTAYLDIGLGLHPQACGQGYGLGFLTCGLAFAKAHFGVSRFRLTAVSTNYRALKVYTRAGFREIGRFERQGLSEPMEFVVMTLDLDQVPGAAGPLSEAPPDYSGPGRP